MLLRFLPFILILCAACATASKTTQMTVVAEDNKDVVALSYLISDYLNKTDNTSFSLSDIAAQDTSGRRITANFSALEVANWPNIWRGGYIVYFKFSANRNTDSIQLTDERVRMPWKVTTKVEIGKTDEQLAAEYDGEIHFYYPERHYHIAEIILRKK